MLQDNESRLEEGFAGVLGQSPENRSAFLDTFCGEDLALRRELEDLLKHHHDGFLDRPALEQGCIREALLSPSFGPGSRLGRYDIIDQLGKGGMAVVYRARRADGAFDRQFAIKVFDRFHSASSDEERFRRESKILGKLDTADVVKIVDVGSENESAYYVMDYIDGAHIDAYCREHALSIPDRLRLFLRVCSVVSLAHNNRIVHRDLKPANILVDKTGAPKLIDFGIAKALDAKPGEAQTIRGLEPMTLLYASPEQLSGDRDVANLPSSDIYALGVILYELLTGRRPLEPPKDLPQFEIPRFLVEIDPAPPSTLDRRLAGDIDTIVLKALRKDRQKRYGSVEQFASYIELFLANRPLPEGPPGMLYKAGKFAKRNRTALSVAALVLVTLLGGVLATQREARIAQRRFNDVRQLATSFLFDFDGKIANLKGATEARQLVVAKGLEYLDKLARDASGDDSLQAEVASAYERLAGIQGNVYGSNLGEYQKAASSYQKALDIRRELVARHPDSAEFKRALGNSYLQLADGWFTSGDNKTATGFYQEGIKILEGLSQSGDTAKEVQVGLQRGYSRLCNFLLTTGDQGGALENCQESVQITKALVSATPGDPALRAALAAAYGLTGNALRLNKRPKEAIAQLEFAAAEFDKLVSEQPNNSNFAKNLAGVSSVLAVSKAALNDNEGALAAYKKAIETARGMVKVDPADVRPKTTLALSLIREAPVLMKLNRPGEAKAAGAEGLALFRSFADRPQATPDDLNNFASYLSEISVPELKDPRTVLAYSKRAVAAVEHPSLVLLSTLTDAYSEVGDLDNAIVTAKRALAENPAPKGAEAGLRADLEKKLRKMEKLSGRRNTR